MPDFDLPNAIGRRLFQQAADLSFHAVTVTRAADEERPSTIVYVNDAFTAMTGYEAEEVLGETPGMLQGPKTDPEVLDRLDRKMQRGETFHGQTINYRKDGSEFVLEWKVTPVGEAKSAAYFIAVQRDVTGRET